MREGRLRGGWACRSLPHLLDDLADVVELEPDDPRRLAWRRRAEEYRRRFLGDGRTVTGPR